MTVHSSPLRLPIAVLTCGEAEGKAKLSPPPRSQVEHRDSARQGRAEHGIHLRSEAESGAMTGWRPPQLLLPKNIPTFQSHLHASAAQQQNLKTPSKDGY